MQDWLTIVILGVVEGVTEFLPVSSTGHLLLAEHWLPRQTELFNVVIQCGAVLAVLMIFTQRLKELVFQWREPKSQTYLAKLAAAFVITAIGGVILKHFHYRLPEKPGPVAWATLVGGVVLIGVERWLKGESLKADVTWGIAIAAGLAQLIAAVFPGTSRSGATIVAALLLGASRPAAIEFSFLLGIPTLLAAGALEILSAVRHGTGAPVDWGGLALGTVVAAVTAFAVVKWLLHYVQNHTFTVFGWYRIVLGALMLIMA
jgi:undecaprenyl-diphosphatase